MLGADTHTHTHTHTFVAAWLQRALNASYVETTLDERLDKRLNRLLDFLLARGELSLLQPLLLLCSPSIYDTHTFAV